MSLNILTTAQVAKSEGVSLRQLQWWDEHKIVSPARVPRSEGNGSFVRGYYERDVRKIRIIRDLKRKGLSLPQIKRILPKLPMNGYVALHGKLADHRRITSLKITCFQQPDQLVAFAVESASPVFVLNI
jgi:DNA-binding transcriptional MerR regulator